MRRTVTTLVAGVALMCAACSSGHKTAPHTTTPPASGTARATATPPARATTTQAPKVPAGTDAAGIAKILNCPVQPPDPNSVDFGPKPASRATCVGPDGGFDIYVWNPGQQATDRPTLTAIIAGFAPDLAGHYTYVEGDGWDVMPTLPENATTYTPAQVAAMNRLAEQAHGRIGGNIRTL